MLGPSQIREKVVRDPVEHDLGRTRVRVSVDRERTAVASSGAARFGELIGSSALMRAVYTVLERAAPTNAPVLITGESGTGKELAADAIHAASPRASRAFEVVDCGGLPPTLIESELFGHEKGAFTGATADREGAFERADGGTLFLDELGELPIDLQPKLLRALGEGEIRRVGAKKGRRVDVRVVAATNRDLRREVNAGRFRPDLFYRLAVIQVRMPPLRERSDDIPVLANVLLARIIADRQLGAPFALDAETLDALARHSWPGNVRELRNYLEQLAILRHAPPLEAGAPDGSTSASFDSLLHLPMHRARATVLEQFERAYVTRLLAECDQNVAEAARRANVDRATIFRIIRRAGLRSSDDGA
jgi:DNA-binding NtrC family response regulator